MLTARPVHAYLSVRTKSEENQVTRMSKMPVLFAGHGSPMNLVEDNDFTRSMKKLSRRLPRPEAICVISSHWQTVGTRVCCNAFPRQIYDFYDFPPLLYDIVYEPEGAPTFALEAIELLGGEEKNVRCNNHSKGDIDWGNDHGAWAVLYHLYPQANIPTFYISVDMHASAREHAELGKKLLPLRSNGVLIVGSGNVVHNLFDLDRRNIDAAPASTGVDFEKYIKGALVENDLDRLITYEHCGSPARYSAPTPDHFMPLLWVAALREVGDIISFPHEGFQNRSISMLSVLIEDVSAA